jgi:hypothetical protein
MVALVEEEEEAEEEEARREREIALMDPHIKRGARAWHEHLGFPQKKESHKSYNYKAKQSKQSAQVLC